MALSLQQLEGDAIVHNLALDAAEPWMLAGAEQEVDGEKVRKYKKYVLRTGKFVKDADGIEFEITGDNLQHFAKEFQRMKDNGVKVSIPATHKNFGDPRHNMGWVDDMFVEGDKLAVIASLVGEEAHAAAAKSDVSIFAPPEYVDGTGERYQRPIVHVAMCTNPVVTGLEGFIPLAASLTKDITASLSNEEQATLAKVESLDTSRTGDAFTLQRVKQLAERWNVSIPENLTLSNVGPVLKKIEKAATAAPENPAPNPPMATMAYSLSSGKSLQGVDPHIVRLSAENRRMKLDGLVAASRLTPAARDQAVARFIGDGNSDKLALELSRGSDGSEFDAFVEIVKANDPIALKEHTRAQTSLTLSDPNNGGVKEKSPVVANAERRAAAATVQK